MYRKLFPLVGLAVCLYGCPRPQKYDRPPLPVPVTWPESAAGPASMSGALAAADIGWREFFADPRLQSVIALALANNRDLRMAALNVEKVQALYRIQRAEAYPVVSAGAIADAYRIPRNLSSSDQAETIAQYTLSLGTTSWELDLFGRIRSLKEQALEQYLATDAARVATRLSLVATVAQSYLALAAHREELELAKSTLATQQSTYDLIRKTRDLGIASDLDLRQAQSQVEVARVDIARSDGQLAQDRNALDLLAGASVAANLLPDNLETAGSMKDVAAGLPSDVLLQRPDILLAEHQLKAAYGNIGAARAAFFPRISLTAGLGLTSSDLTDLFKIGSGTWQLTPQAILPIFDIGVRKANYQVAQVDRDLAVAEYEMAIQSAFREVSDALALRTTLLAQQEAQLSLVNALGEALRLAEARYRQGVDSYLSVLVAQRSAYVAQHGLVSVRLARLANLVSLYKTLGGGGAPVHTPGPVLPGGNASGSVPSPAKFNSAATD